MVFGNRCAAAQILPAILPRVKQLTQLARSRHWVMPPVDKAVSARLRWWLQRASGMLWLQRFIIFWLAEADFPAYVTGMRWYRARRQKVAEAYMRREAPGRYHGLLIPEFAYGTKRRVFDSGYLRALARGEYEVDG